MAKTSGNREKSEKPEMREAGTRRGQIEHNLRRVYDETLNEPLPEKLADLLERIRKQGRG